MKNKIFLLFMGLCAALYAWGQPTITETGGWMESAWVKWAPVDGADSYNVYYTGGGYTNKKIDTQLIRSYGSYFRADVLGLAAGSYTITVRPVISGTEGAGTTSDAITVLTHDRTGFAFQGGHIVGAYNMDGTPKTGAVVLYITQNTKNTVSMTVTGATKNPCVGIQTILDGFKKGKDTRPLIVRFIGNITDMSYLTNGDLYISNAQNASCSMTLEGVGDDAVTNGWSFCLKSATNIEIRNIAAMNNNSTNGDDFGLQQDNDHVWIHNCEMYYGDAGSDADQIKGDGAMDIKKSTYVTVSYNHFVDNGKSSLLGLSEGTTTGLYVTYHHNWFDHSDSRHPRVRFYSVHVYNNYYDGVAKYGAGSTMGSSLFVEGNYYRNSKHPMMISLQGTDIWNSSKQINDAKNMGTFSGEAGGMIKAFNNTFDADNGTNDMRFVAYGDPSAAFNIAGVISSTTDFDAYVAATRDEQVPATVKSFSGSNTYNNFDTDAALYIKTLVPDSPADAKIKTMQYAGRTNGGDIKWSFNNTVDDAAYLVNTALKNAVTNYTTKLVFIQGESNAATNSQTLTLTSSNNNEQTVISGNAISAIVYTWGGSATGATVTGLDGTGLSYATDATAQTITISGIPIDTVSYTVTTIGTSGSAISASGTITITASSDQTLVLTSGSANQTVTSGTAITSIIYTWGGTATGAIVTGLDGTGLSYATNADTRTVAISGTPSATVNYSITTEGTGTSVSASGTITVKSASSGNMIHNFTTDGTTSSFYTFADCNLSTQYGTVTYNNLSLTQCLKMEGKTSITFTSTQSGTLTLVFNGANTGTITIDGTIYNVTSTGMVTVTLAAGTHTIAKKSSATYLFYMCLVYDNITTGIDTPSVSKILIYPNPVVNSLNITSEAALKSVEIYSLTGVLVMRTEGDTHTIDLGKLSKGSYLVKALTVQGVHKQLIIKK